MGFILAVFGILVFLGLLLIFPPLAILLAILGVVWLVLRGRK